MRYSKHSLAILFILCILHTYAQRQDGSQIIPVPAHVRQTAALFKVDRKVKIAYNDSTARKVAALLGSFVSDSYGAKLTLTKGKGSGYKSIKVIHDAGMKPESYTLSIKNTGVILRGDAAGVFYGLQTLQQLFPLKKARAVALPGVEIADEPRFAYRGLMLDVSRHFFTVDYIKKLLDAMAFLKLNRFHWHLTDDQGWRIEIKRYPELQRVAAWRTPTPLENNSPQIKDGRYGGYYTQQEIREVVAYAAKQHINIIPEIEMPGHSNAALAAYPNLGCINQQYQVLTSGTISQNVYCAGNDEVFTFLQNVIDEIVQLFPGKYIHIGGDETPKDRWKVCPKCQARIKAEGLKDEYELQSYFVQRIEKYINSKGRQIIGWDEILEGGLAPNATVMSWRGEVGGIEAARLHHDVIMTPYHYVYFDYYQGRQIELEPHATGAYLPLSKVYSYDPVPTSLMPDQQKYIKGVQANTWAEQIPNETHADYMVFPRALALAEIGWSLREKKNYTDFLHRLPKALAMLEARHVNFRIPEPFGLKDSLVVGKSRIIMQLTPSVQGSKVYYTLDGSKPDIGSSKLNSPVTINLMQNQPVVLKTLTVLASGRQSAIYTANLVSKPLLKASIVKPDKEGLSFRASFQDVELAKQINLTKADTTGIVTGFSIIPFASKPKFNAIFEGYFLAETDGIYTFKVRADDGALLYLDNELTVDNDGRHPAIERSGAIPLQKGYHSIQLKYFDAGGGKTLDVSVAKEDTAYTLEKRLMVAKNE